MCLRLNGRMTLCMHPTNGNQLYLVFIDLIKAYVNLHIGKLWGTVIESRIKLPQSLYNMVNAANNFYKGNKLYRNKTRQGHSK